MMSTDEKLCLQWKDFKKNVTSAFGDLRQDKEITDVTLACEDGQQVEAHRVVLVAFLPEHLEEEQTSTSVDLPERCRIGESAGHSGLLISWASKCLPGKSRLVSCSSRRTLLKH